MPVAPTSPGLSGTIQPTVAPSAPAAQQSYVDLSSRGSQKASFRLFFPKPGIVSIGRPILKDGGVLFSPMVRIGIVKSDGSVVLLSWESSLSSLKNATIVGVQLRPWGRGLRTVARSDMQAKILVGETGREAFLRVGPPGRKPTKMYFLQNRSVQELSPSPEYAVRWVDTTTSRPTNVIGLRPDSAPIDVSPSPHALA